MKKVIFIIALALISSMPSKADVNWSDVKAVVNALYDKIPDAEYQIMIWLNGELKYTKASSCEDARRIAYTLLYQGKADQVKISSKYPTTQTRCWISGTTFTQSNMDQLL